jgi:hypothetical protein
LKQSTEFKFCFCGRPAITEDNKCSKHLGKEPPPKKKKIGKYSGYSKWFETNGQNKEEDDG